MNGFRTVTIPDLVVGDIVYQHGGVFQVTKRVELQPRREYPTERGVSCHTRYLGLAAGATFCSIPEHWRVDWHIQGNERAHVAVHDGQLEPCLVCGEAIPVGVRCPTCAADQAVTS